jgi:tripartite-type tricarboxylate transporter receptor subunit TctC
MSRNLVDGIALLWLGVSRVQAAETAQDFYKGKTITYIVATSPGGGYDSYGRLVARYMNKYLPGSKIIIRNMPGAGHVIGANTIYARGPTVSPSALSTPASSTCSCCRSRACASTSRR